MACILLIDDEDLTRRTLQLALENAGHAVAAAANGDEGLVLDACITFDVVVTDMMMPGRDGAATIMELKRRRPDLRVIAMSGSGATGRVDFLKLARQVGAEVTLEKPFQAAALLRAIG
jgi:CheY-like chemotaxis protein